MRKLGSETENSERRSPGDKMQRDLPDTSMFGKGPIEKWSVWIIQNFGLKQKSTVKMLWNLLLPLTFPDIVNPFELNSFPIPNCQNYRQLITFIMFTRYVTQSDKWLIMKKPINQKCGTNHDERGHLQSQFFPQRIELVCLDVWGMDHIACLDLAVVGLPCLNHFGIE